MNREKTFKRLKLTAAGMLFIYCAIFLLANSPLHIYLFHSQDIYQERNLAETSFFESKKITDCPLCEFLSMVLSSGPLSVSIGFLLLLCCRVFSRNEDSMFPPKLKFYDALAPPVTPS